MTGKNSASSIDPPSGYREASTVRRRTGGNAASLTLDRVEKRFGGLSAVSALTFRVEAGAIFGLIGPNGAGKTTVFNLVTGVYRADVGGIRLGDGEGAVELVGSSPSAVAAAGVARTFQNIRLFASMTVLENVLVAGELQRRSGLFGEVARTRRSLEDERALDARARKLLSEMGLAGLEDAPATSLPYGSQRRLEIARALMLRPKLLLLDEPAAGLNYGEAESLQAQIKALRDEYDLTVLLVEHNMQVVMGVCERIHVLDHGETIAEGTPDQIKRDRKVIAAYLGEESEDAVPDALAAEIAAAAGPGASP